MFAPGRRIKSLVRILHRTLIFLRQSVHDGLVRFFHHAVHVFFALAFGIDGVVDGHRQRMPLRPLGGTGQYIERTVDGDGYDGELKLVGQLEGTALEVTHVAGKAS